MFNSIAQSVQFDRIVQQTRLLGKSVLTQKSVNDGWVDLLHLFDAEGKIEILNLESSSFNVDHFDVTFSVNGI
jgi:hypothetical protein